jgi:thymidylate kinase
VRTALAGTDGTGKTTVARLLSQLDGVAVIHAIRAHDDPGSPYAPLSRHLAAASAAADRTGSLRIKLAVLCLQLCLYGPQERSARLASPIVVADRHPLIDPLVYLPLYARLARGSAQPPDAEQQWWDAQPRDTARAVRNWLDECSDGRGAVALGNDLLDIAALPRDGMLTELARRFAVGPPDRVVLLDLPVAEALARTQRRSAAAAELHETVAALTSARRAYQEVLSWLAPAVRVHRVDASGPPEQVTAEVSRLAGAKESRPGFSEFTQNVSEAGQHGASPSRS